MPHGIDALLLDVEGVLVRHGLPLPGALEATVRLRAAGVPFRLLTNICRRGTADLAGRLEALGFSIDPEEIWNPPRLAARLLRRAGARAPATCLSNAVRDAELPDVGRVENVAAPDLLLLGDAGDDWNPATAERVTALLAAGVPAWLLSRRPDPRVFDLDPESSAGGLHDIPGVAESAHRLIGKPSREAFQVAAGDFGLPEGAAVVMIGDDLEVDIAGAQGAGLRGALVLSGRTTPADLVGSGVRPDLQADDLGAFVHRWLKIR